MTNEFRQRLTAVDTALLLAEWGAPGGRCPVCGDHSSHGPECAMDLALAERGWPTKAARNLARVNMGAPGMCGRLLSLMRRLPLPTCVLPAGHDGDCETAGTRGGQ